jgi:hypothetical protein
LAAAAHSLVIWLGAATRRGMGDDASRAFEPRLIFPFPVASLPEHAVATTMTARSTASCRIDVYHHKRNRGALLGATSVELTFGYLSLPYSAVRDGSCCPDCDRAASFIVSTSVRVGPPGNHRPVFSRPARHMPHSVGFPKPSAAIWRLGTSAPMEVAGVEL